MKRVCQPNIAWLFILMMMLAVGRPILSAAPRAEEALLKDLSSRLPVTVVSALKGLETQYPKSTNANAEIRKLLTDKRPMVRRKAARVLGAVHAPVNENDIKNICALLKSSDTDDNEDGILALRGLDAPQVIPEILPFLKHRNTHLIRDACRALAVLGNKEIIAAIEPLLNHPEEAVRKDAQDAIAKLRAKP